jgi:hypothetical protein
MIGIDAVQDRKEKCKHANVKELGKRRYNVTSVTLGYYLRFLSCCKVSEKTCHSASELRLLYTFIKINLTSTVIYVRGYVVGLLTSDYARGYCEG